LLESRQNFFTAAANNPDLEEQRPPSHLSTGSQDHRINGSFAISCDPVIFTASCDSAVILLSCVFPVILLSRDPVVL
jgi:hypothetical protein